MTPTKAAKKPKLKAPEKEEKPVFKKKISMGKPRNYDLGNGVMRFSRTRMYHKKAIYKFVGKKTEATKKMVKPIFKVKPIRGDRNGKKRKVPAKKSPLFHATQKRIAKRPAKKCFKQHQRHLRTSLQPGTVVILLAGSHKGKRVVFLKQLHSGLLLVTGPFGINACPMRRVSQRYVIGTKTRIDMSDVKISDKINDEYFRRHREKRPKKAEGDIFQTKKEGYKVSEQRKEDQKEIDKQIMEAIKKHSDRKLMLAYLSAMFGLRSSQYPHRMKF